jgi:hypothetical protein
MRFTRGGLDRVKEINEKNRNTLTLPKGVDSRRSAEPRAYEKPVERTSTFIEWTFDTMVEIQLKTDDDFLKIKETLTRMGVASNRDKILYQSTHILHKQGRYYIVHFKELFALDGRNSTIESTDLERRNAIIKLLEEWGLLDILDKDKLEPMGHVGQFKIISFKEKANWTLTPKYNIGNR